MCESEAILIRVGRVEVKEAVALLCFGKSDSSSPATTTLPWPPFPVGCLSQGINPICLPVAAAKEHGLSFLPLLEFHGVKNRSRYHPSTGTGNESSVSFPCADFHSILPLYTRCSAGEPSPRHAPTYLSYPLSTAFPLPDNRWSVLI